MANSPMAVLTFMALGLAAALLSAAGPAAAQNCGCQPGFCCSQFGFCGTTDPYCGKGCQSGPCTGSGSGSGSGGVGSIVSDAFFNAIKSKSSGGCAGQSFYTRAAFLNAAGSYSGFASGSSDAAKREIAAFFAHVTHETGHFCYIEEINGASQNYCDTSFSQWPCSSGAKYYGRGPLQLTWNYNYGAAGKSIGFDGLGSPQTVAQDPVVAFKTALWYWMTNVHGVLPRGFGATTRAINGAVECDGKNTAQMNARVGYYQDYCRQLGVDAGGSLTC
ncbi:endochitinase A-like [Lolium perenne]|uniref:endochitinase A n=1 Tax=Lolium perenne TaxID=4522 RepID=UPI0021F55583|nr:endochitinase A-like [Lolium perenne]XP_051185272.1 endochitinase A-like [Lolium perenne]